MSTAVLASQTRLLTVSKGGEVTLWNAATGSLQGKQRLSSVKEETPTCAVAVQKQGKMVTGFSSGSVSLVRSSAAYDASIGSAPKYKNSLEVGRMILPCSFSCRTSSFLILGVCNSSQFRKHLWVLPGAWVMWQCQNMVLPGSAGRQHRTGSESPSLTGQQLNALHQLHKWTDAPRDIYVWTKHAR